MDLAEVAHQSLLHHLRTEGLPARLEAGEVALGLGGATCRCHVGDVIRHPHVVLVSLWFDTSLRDERRLMIQESLPGIGETPEEAVVKGAHLWVEGVLPPLRKFLHPAYEFPRDHTLPLVSQLVGSSEQTRWDVYCGPLLLMGEAGEALHRLLAERPPLTWMMNAVTACTAEIRPHWVKAFLTRQPDGSLLGEVRIDNALSEDGLAELQGFEWPSGQGFIGFRQFMLLVPRETGSALESRLSQALRERYPPDHPDEARG